jgi:hypothetical protein
LVVATLFLFSLLGLLFPIHDFMVFGRKDAFIIAALALSVVASFQASRKSAFFSILLIYFITGLLVETAWLYFPITVSIFALRRGADAPLRWHLILWSIAGVYLGACLGWMYVINNDLPSIGIYSLQQQAIASSWQQEYPNAYLSRDALTWLGWPLR